MGIKRTTRNYDSVEVENDDGDVFYYSPVLPERKQLVLVGIQLADRTKGPEALAAAQTEALKTGVLKP